MANPDLELIGEEKEKAVKRAKEVVASWGLKLPDVYACPFHFGLNDFYKIGEIEFDINNNIKEGYCGKLMFILKDQICPLHHHRVKHETFFIIKGSVLMTTDGKDTVLNQGDILVIDQQVIHSFQGLEDSLILESSKPDIIDDSIFEDEKINEKILKSIQ